MRLSTSPGAAALLALTILLSPLAHAQVVRTWVSTNATDNLSCSRATPCRTFGAAVAAVDAGGEVVVLDSGGYGAFTISKSVSIVAPAGIYAAIAPTSGTGINVAAGVSDVVRLTNLGLTSNGADTGISYVSGKSLAIEGCSVHGFSTSNIELNGPRTSVSRTIVSGGYRGIVAVTYEGLAMVSVSDSTLRNNVNTGLYAGYRSRIVVADSNASQNQTGFTIWGGFDYVAELTVERSVIALNTTGIYMFGESSSSPTAVLRISNTTIVNNDTGVTTGGNSIAYSRSNNTIAGNAQNIFGSLTALAPQ